MKRLPADPKRVRPLFAYISMVADVFDEGMGRDARTTVAEPPSPWTSDRGSQLPRSRS